MIISWALIGLGFLMGVLISISSKAAVYNSYFYTYRTLGNKVMMISLPIILVILITLIIKYRKYEEVNTPLKVLASLLAVFTFLFMLYSEWMAQAFLLHRFDSAQFANFKLQEVKPPPGQLYTTSSPNPSGKSTGKLIIINADNGKIDPLFLELDGKHMATSPDEVSTVAVVRFDTSHVGSYKSSTGYAGEAYRENCAVQIIDRKTDELLYNYSFSGKGLPSSSKSSATATVDRDAVTKYLNSL
ncbi:MAG TPA: hypothetical protein VN426_14640 [Syntrophomonadaceae bacterium]|nr:hypothetical protein [Syntrophomonadaceae bacterium]